VVRVHLSRPVQVQGKGDRGDPDFRSLLYLYGGRFLSYKECVGEAREDGLDREAMPMPLLYDRIPIICSLRRRRQGRGTEHVLSSTSIRH
jgi:hypothetical protein